MRRALLAAIFTLLTFGVTGGVMAAPEGGGPPKSDPTCRERNGEETCPGDNGDEGCRGVERAEALAPEQPAPAFDLVTDILGEGAENDCDPSNDDE